MNNEIEIFKYLHTEAIIKNIVHIPSYYHNVICDKIIRRPEYPDLLYTAAYDYKYYSLLFFETADGDLSSFIRENSLDDNLWKNMYEQLFMCIFTLHHHGYIHNNSIRCNFIYRKIEKKGCFHYKINGEDYYIENLGILWMIYNYERCEELDTKVKYLFLQDYYQLNIELCHRDAKFEKNANYISETNNPLNIHINKDNKVSGKLSNAIILPETIINLQNELWNKFLLNTPNSFLKGCVKNNKNSSDFIKILCDENLLYSKKPIGEVIYSTYY